MKIHSTIIAFMVCLCLPLFMLAQNNDEGKQKTVSFENALTQELSAPTSTIKSKKEGRLENIVRSVDNVTIDYPAADGCKGLSVIDFEGIVSSSFLRCSNVINSDTDDNCYDADYIPEGIEISFDMDFSNENQTILVSNGVANAVSSVFGPNFNSSDTKLDFSIPVNYVEFDIQTLNASLNNTTFDIEVYDESGSLAHTQTVNTAVTFQQKVVISSNGLISSVIVSDDEYGFAFEGIDNIGFAYNPPCGYVSSTIGCDDEEDASFDNLTGEYSLTTDGCYYGSPYNADAMTTLTQELCGDGEIIVKFEGGSSIGWAGINMRETLDSGSKKVQMMQNGSFFGRREVRTMTNGFAFPQQMFVFGKPWMRLVRNGNQFSGYVSANGVNWQFVMTQLVSMADCIEVGMVATTINVNTTYTATFSNVQVIQAGEGLQAVPNTIAQSNAALGLGLTPNPARDLVTLNLDQVIGEAATISIFNMNGQLMEMIQYDSIEDANEEINISSLPVGTYYVNVKTTSTQQTLKLIKQ